MQNDLPQIPNLSYLDPSRADEDGSLVKLRLVESDLSKEGADRQSCQINRGADFVISNLLPFLDKVCREDKNPFSSYSGIIEQDHVLGWFLFH
jgi:hypothetical protein